jgi:hypothetical protein
MLKNSCLSRDLSSKTMLHPAFQGPAQFGSSVMNDLQLTNNQWIKILLNFSQFVLAGLVCFCVLFKR